MCVCVWASKNINDWHLRSLRKIDSPSFKQTDKSTCCHSSLPDSLLDEAVRIQSSKSSKGGVSRHSLFKTDDFRVGRKDGGLIDIQYFDGNSSRRGRRGGDPACQVSLVRHHHHQREGIIPLIVDRLDVRTQTRKFLQISKNLIVL